MCGGVGLELVSDELPRRLALFFQDFAKKTFGSSLVATSSHQDVENITVLINSSPQVDLPSVDLQEQLIHVPDVAQSALLLSDRAGVSWPHFQTPQADCLIGDNDSSLGQQILDVSKAKCEAVLEPHRMIDDFGSETMASIQ